jgi:hypothetical protein
MDGCVKSLDGNQYAQIFSDGGFFAELYHMARKADAGLALKTFIMKFGFPNNLTIDESKKQNSKGTTFCEKLQKKQHPSHHNRTRAPELEPHRRSNLRSMMALVPDYDQETDATEALDYGIRWTVPVMQRTSTQAGGLQGACPLEVVTGETVKHLEYLDFGFYNHVSLKENAGLKVTSIGRWLGVTHILGGLMSYWVLAMQGTIISHTIVQRVTTLHNEIQRRGAYSAPVCVNPPQVPFIYPIFLSSSSPTTVLDIRTSHPEVSF